MAVHSGLWVGNDGELSVRQFETPTASSLTPGQHLVKAAYSGVNPADQKHAKAWGIGDRVAGYDAVGTIVASGAETRLKVGTRVSVLAKTGLAEHPERYGAHQEFLVAEEAGCFPIPEETPMHVAATIPVVVATAADCLFSLFHFEPTSCDSNRVPLIIWGGSSAVGNATIQLARAVGIWPIIVTASPRHHAELTRRGATVCVDYKDDKVLDKIRASVEQLVSGKALRHAVDTVGKNTEAITALCDAGQDPLLACTVGGDHSLSIPFAGVIFGYNISIGKGRVIPARVKDAQVVREKIIWALDHLGGKFEQVPVTTVSGYDELRKYIVLSAEGGVSFCKYVAAASA